MADRSGDRTPHEPEFPAPNSAAEAAPIDLDAARRRRRENRIAGLAAFLGVPADVMNEALTIVATSDSALTRPRPDAA